MGNVINTEEAWGRQRTEKVIREKKGRGGEKRGEEKAGCVSFISETLLLSVQPALALPGPAEGEAHGVILHTVSRCMQFWI